MRARTGFLHLVYFYLPENACPESARQLAEAARKYLTHIPDVLRLEIGFPANTPRDVVDNTYGVALLVEFADREAHDRYQDHPDHLRFIQECRPLWATVRVYDTLLLP